MNNKLKLLSVAALLACFFAAVSLAQATEKSPLLLLPTTSKAIYVLYHKMTKSSFDAESVIRSTETYKNASPEQQATLLAKEKLSLATMYANTDTERQVIVIRSAVKIEVSLSPPKMTVEFSDPPRPPSSVYFPYSWAGKDIALIPDQLSAFSEIPLKTAEAMAANAKVAAGAATIVIEMLPLSADNRPMQLDGVSQSLLMTKVVAVSYYNQNMQTIWQWQSPDYKRPGSPSELQDLKK